MTLNQMNTGQRATIIEPAPAHSDFRQHCSDLGFDIGVEIELMRRASGRGPLQIKVLDTLYAIRPDDAEQIHIEVDSLIDCD